MGCGPEIQMEALNSFSPKSMHESDFSRQLTSYLRKIREDPNLVFSAGASGRIHGPNQAGGGLLRAFRARYPMDDRAFDFLEQAPAEVQEIVITDFQPRRDDD